MVATFPKRLDSIQALRGIAAILVLFFHIAELQRQQITQYYTKITSDNQDAEMALTRGIWDSGGSGVDLFFVISGFVMVYVTRNHVPSIGATRSFLWARITRIYPIWWIFALIMPVYFLWAYNIPGPPDRLADVDHHWIYVLKSLALLPQSTAPVLGLGWTLIHEMHFYLVFSVLLLFKRQYLPWLLGLWALVIVAANVNGLVYYEATGWRSLSLSRLSLEFIGGAIAAIFLLRWKIYAPKTCILLGIISGLAAMYLKSAGLSAGVGRVVLFAFPFVLIVYGAVGLELNERLSIWRPLTLLGDWSYSLYLCHYIVIVATYRILEMGLPFIPAGVRSVLTIGSDGIMDNILNALFVTVLSVLTASLSYYYLERPILSRFRKRRKVSI